MKEPEEPRNYVIFPEEAIKYLPEEWQKHLHAINEEALGILEAADKDLTILNRIVHAYPTMASLRYIQHRLASTKFEATTEWMFENDMLTLAFVTTYARLVQGGIGSGVSRKTLPTELRSVHDSIVELRNKRYAHNDKHESITGRLDIGFEEGSFNINVNFSMGIHVGGAHEWEALVVFLDELMVNRLHTQLKKLKEKTGYAWSFPSGPPPKWVQTAADRSVLIDNDGI